MPSPSILLLAVVLAAAAASARPPAVEQAANVFYSHHAKAYTLALVVDRYGAAAPLKRLSSDNVTLTVRARAVVSAVQHLPATAAAAASTVALSPTSSLYKAFMSVEEMLGAIKGGGATSGSGTGFHYSPSWGYPLGFQITLGADIWLSHVGGVTLTEKDAARVALMETWHSAWTVWQGGGNKFRDYHFTTKMSCFCKDTWTRAAVVSVHRDDVVGVKYLDTGKARSPLGMRSIAHFFIEAETAINRSPLDSLQLRYNARLGYPELLHFEEAQADAADRVRADVPTIKIWDVAEGVAEPPTTSERSTDPAVIVIIVFAVLVLVLWGAGIVYFVRCRRGKRHDHGSDDDGAEAAAADTEEADSMKVPMPTAAGGGYRPSQPQLATRPAALEERAEVGDEGGVEMAEQVKY
jgi:hypothetical protein